MSDRKIPTSIRLPEAVRNKLKELASKDRRDESDYIRKVLWDHVDAAERDGRLSPQAEFILPR